MWTGLARTVGLIGTDHAWRLSGFVSGLGPAWWSGSGAACFLGLVMVELVSEGCFGW
jgi:hypothetical protein